MTTILSAIISAAAAIVVSIINSNYQHRRLLAEVEKHDEMNAYRIEQLEKKVEKHNGVIERMAVAENKIRVSEHRIDDLERRTEKNDEFHRQ